MKLLFSIASCVLLLLPACAAFAPRTNLVATTQLFADASSVIAEALEISKQYGATSPEARVAWDAVEEVSAADNSAATKGSLDEECELDEEGINAACMDYNEKMETLQQILADSQPKVQTMKNLAQELKAIKMTVSSATPKPSSPELRAALESAKETEATFGKGSPEAIVAWSELEDVAAAGLGNALGGRLDEECLVDAAMEACQAIEELNRALAEAENE